MTTTTQLDRVNKAAERINQKNRTEPLLPQLDSQINQYRGELRELNTQIGRLNKEIANDPKFAETNPKEVSKLEKLNEDLHALRTNPALNALATFQLLKETRDYASSIVPTLTNHSHAATEQLAKINRGVRRLDQRIEKFMKDDRAAFFAVGEYRLAKFVDEITSGRIVRTPDVEKIIANAKAGLVKKRSVTLHGDTGGGKTEMARIIAKETTGKDALVVRCYHGMPISDLYGSQTLVGSQSSEDMQTLLAGLEKQCQDWDTKNPEKDADARERAYKKIYSTESVTISQFLEGAIYQAMREGKVVILDEFNALPDNIRLGLNEILIKKPGDEMTVAETGEAFVVAVGFGIIQTANINYDGGKKYSGLHTVQVSQKERTHFEAVGALPQQLLASYAANQGLNESQLYAIALVAALNHDLSLSAVPQNLDQTPLESVWRLTQLAAVTQQIFAGKLESTSEYVYQENGVPTNVELSIQISNRRLITVIETWKRSGTNESLDNILLNQVVLQADNYRERRYLYQLAQKHGFLNVDDGWPAETSFRNFHDFDRIERPDIEPKPLAHVEKSDVVEALFGRAPVGEVVLQQSALAQRAEQTLEELGKQIEQWEKELGLVCPLS